MARIELPKGIHSLLALLFILCSLGIPGEEMEPPKPKRATARAESWKKTYEELKERVAKIDDQVSRQFFPEFPIIREGNRIAILQIDAFAAKVLKEVDEVLLPYRQGLEACIERRQNEYRPAQVYSFERFAWLLDAYVQGLVATLGGAEEQTTEPGVRERRVTTDRTLYAFTRLIVAYLEERQERMSPPETSYASDRKLEAAVLDVGKRVFRLDLTRRFDRKELVEKGTASQPVFRELASFESAPAIGVGLDPLVTLMRSSGPEPPCEILLTRKTASR